MDTKSGIFTRLCHSTRENTAFGVHSVKLVKIDLTLKKSNILYILDVSILKHIMNHNVTKLPDTKAGNQLD